MNPERSEAEDELKEILNIWEEYPEYIRIFYNLASLKRDALRDRNPSQWNWLLRNEYKSISILRAL